MNRVVLLVLVVLAACAPVRPGRGCSTPVDVLVDSRHTMDFVVRDSYGRRLGLAYSLRVTRMAFCASPGDASDLTIDPIGADAMYHLDGGMPLQAGTELRVVIQPRYQESFVEVRP